MLGIVSAQYGVPDAALKAPESETNHGKQALTVRIAPEFSTAMVAAGTA